MARAMPCALLALAYAKAPSPTARRLPDVRGLHRVFGFRSVSSLPLLDHRWWGLFCLGLPPAMLVQRRLALRPERAHSDCRADSHGAPIPRAHGRGGPPFPSCSSPACYARARQGSGGLRESGVRLWRAFLSADANEPCSRLSLLLRVRFDCPVGGGVGRSISCRAVLIAGRPKCWSTRIRAARQVAPLMPQGLKPCRISPTHDGTVSRPQRPRGYRPSGAADVLARWLPRCPSTSCLGLPLEPLTLTARRARPPHDRLPA